MKPNWNSPFMEGYINRMAGQVLGFMDHDRPDDADEDVELEPDYFEVSDDCR